MISSLSVPIRHLASLDDTMHVAKSIRSVRRGLRGIKGDQRIDCQTSKLFLQQNHISAFESE